MIKLTESLTKENIWDDLSKKYPDAMKMFCDYVDDYKETVAWKRLFGEATRPDWVHRAPKFHELPYGLQIGIWIEFTTTTEGFKETAREAMDKSIRSYMKYSQLVHEKRYKEDISEVS